MISIKWDKSVRLAAYEEDLCYSSIDGNEIIFDICSHHMDITINKNGIKIKETLCDLIEFRNNQVAYYCKNCHHIWINELDDIKRCGCGDAFVETKTYEEVLKLAIGQISILNMMIARRDEFIDSITFG